MPKQGHVGSGERARARHIRTVADDDEAAVRQGAEGLDNEWDALVGHEARGGYVEVELAGRLAVGPVIHREAGLPQPVDHERGNLRIVFGHQDVHGGRMDDGRAGRKAKGARAGGGPRSPLPHRLSAGSTDPAPSDP